MNGERTSEGGSALQVQQTTLKQSGACACFERTMRLRTHDSFPAQETIKGREVVVVREDEDERLEILSERPEHGRVVTCVFRVGSVNLRLI